MIYSSTYYAILLQIAATTGRLYLLYSMAIHVVSWGKFASFILQPDYRKLAFTGNQDGFLLGIARDQDRLLFK